MKYTFFCVLFLIGALNFLNAQDRMVLRDGKTFDVKVHRSTDTHVYYTYPGETSVYERPKAVISYILYSDGKREVFDDNRLSSGSNTTVRAATGGTTAPAARNSFPEEDVFWEDVKITYTEADVRGMTRLERISAVSSVSTRDALQQLRKKAADLGGTTILVMDIPEKEDIEIMGIAYRDEITTVPRNANARNVAPVESASDVRRRTINQQMESYNNESNLRYEDNSRNARNAPPARTPTQPSRNTAPQSRQSNANNAEPDAVYLNDGRVIRGIIDEHDPDEFVSIITPNGRIYEFYMDEVRRVSQTSVRSNGRQAAPSRPSSPASPRGNARYDDDRYGYNNRNSSRYNDDYYYDYGVSGYKGIVDVGFNFSLGGTGEKGNFEINTSHGYQINEYLFAGAGLGLHIFNARDTAMKNPSNYPHYVGNTNLTTGKIVPTDSVTYIRGVDSSFMTFPIFLDVRGYLPLQNSNLSPFFMIRFGYAFNLSDGFKGMGLYMNPAVGLKYQLSPMIGLNFSVGYAYQSYGGIPRDGGYGYYYIKDSSNAKYEAKGSGGISLKLGIEF